MCSRAEQCTERLESRANSVPHIVLIELRNSATEAKDTNNASFHFLRTLCTDIRGAHYQRYVMPFALVIPDAQPGAPSDLDQELTTECLRAGAVDMLRSPLPHDDINRMIGHFKELNRPPAHLIGAPMAQNLVDSINDVSKPPRMDIYRPDEMLSAEQKAAVENTVHRWHFPAQQFNMDELTYAALYMLEHVLSSPELQEYRMERRQLIAFLLATRRQYKHEREVHYHNWRHAVDVSQSVFSFLLDLQVCPPLGTEPETGTTPLERLLTPLDGLILLVSAIGHDVGHPGVNNAFLVACNHPLAQTYNDKSVLENYHCAAYQQLLRRHWPSLNQITAFRATMISTILATDMQRHFEYMSHLSQLQEKLESGQFSVEDMSDKDRESEREMMMALLIKAADISNVARPYEIAARWARTLMHEFARQGELESELQIPTCLFGGPPNTEDMLAAAQSQKGFLSLFGLPLFQGIADIMPSLSPALRELKSNQTLWNQRIDEEKRRRDDNSMEPPHFGSVTKDQMDIAQLEQQKSAPSALPAEAIQALSGTSKGSSIASSEPSKRTIGERRNQALPRHLSQEKRASAPILGSILPPGISSRRSSKDVALDSLHLQQSIASSHDRSDPGSRRGSADAGLQVQQSYPGSRRGSKDESLTTILVTSGSPNRRNSPSAPGMRLSPPKSSRKQAAARSSPRLLQSPSTPTPEDGILVPALGSIPSTEDPFIMPGSWGNDLDGTHRASVQDGMHRDSLPDPSTSTEGEGLPSSPPPPPHFNVAKSESSRASTREVGEEGPLGETGADGLRGRGLRASRSRSRLRALKFWRRSGGRDQRRDVAGEDAAIG